MCNILNSRSDSNAPWPWHPLQISKQHGHWTVFNPRDNKYIKGFTTHQAAEQVATNIAITQKG